MRAIPETEFGARVRTRLRDEKMIWLVTVGADGTPQPNPVWFWWDGDGDRDTVLVYNRADAYRLAHMAARPQVSLHFDSDGRGEDIVVLAGTARQVAGAPGPHEHDGYLAKYGAPMAGISGTAEQFGAEYPVAVEVAIRRVRGF